jgi:hypothetical protein
MSKLDSKNIQGIFVGYDDKSYRVWMLVERRLCISRDVSLFESPTLQTMTQLKDFTKETFVDEN